MTQRLILIGSIILGNFLAVNSAQSQILTDDTTDTSILGNCQTSCQISGGIVAGDNLFHSFQEFNLDSGASVYFTDTEVGNIFSRVTGGNPSEIMGTLGVRGNANLFLLNPNGIIFGEGATLDLNGSFIATTADELQFGDHAFAANPDSLEDIALLTVQPSAFFFNQTGEDGSIQLNGANLTVPPQHNITLLGQGDRFPGIELQNSRLRVTEGNINLGAVKDSVSIELQENFRLDFPPDVIRGDITIADRSNINLINTGEFVGTEIRLNSGNLELKGDSQILSFTIGNDSINNVRGADIVIDAQESVKIIGENSNDLQQFLVENLTPGSNARFSNVLQTATSSNNDAGNIKITTPNLLIDRGGGIVSSTQSAGKSGNIDLNIEEIVSLKSSGLFTGSAIQSAGDVGEIKIQTKQLLVEQNGVISSSTLGSGNAGALSISASETIEIKDTLANAVVPTGIYTNTVFGNGTGGNLTIDTPRLRLQNGGQLSASSGVTRFVEDVVNVIPFGGAGGNINLTVADAIEVRGQSADGNFASSILSDTVSNNAAGNLTIETGSLFVDSDGLISTSSIGNGAGGNIEIIARNGIEIEGAGVSNLETLIQSGLQGELNLGNMTGGVAAFTIRDGAAGGIKIDTADLSLDQGAIISTATYGSDDAGSLEINATDKINVNASAIISPTFASGNGGRIDLQTQNLDITDGGSIAAASLGRGNAGDINIIATESISISDTISNLLFSGSISSGNYSGQGGSGNLEINTQRLAIKDGASIETNNIALISRESADNVAPQEVASIRPQGFLKIDASESITISGMATGENPFHRNLNSHISSASSTSNPASNLIIKTGELSISDGSDINVSSLGTGGAGILQINADNITLSDQANLSGITSSGQGGDIINLQIADLLRINDHSIISTNAIAEGNGGDINITADFVIATQQSTITANAEQEGSGGNINITAQDVFLSRDSMITANSTLGIDGTVEIETVVDMEHNNDTKLPQKVIQEDYPIARICSSYGNLQGTFSSTGRGGLPFNPLTEFQGNNIVLADFEIPQYLGSNHQIQVNQKLDILSSPMVEANQWLVNDQGQVELVAASNRQPTAFNSASANCAAFKL